MATDAQVYAEAVERRQEHLAHQYEAGQKVLRRGWGLTALHHRLVVPRQARLVAAAAGLRSMQDAVTWQNVSAGVQLAGGYDDGLYAWPKVAWDTVRSRGQVAVHYVVNPAHNFGQVLDIEQGDATPAQGPGWVAMRRRSGFPFPGVYCSVSVWPQVIGEFRAQGVPEPSYDIAAYPGIGPVLYAGSAAHQYADPGPVDLSVVAPYWPAVDGGAPPAPPPTPPAPPRHREDHDMYRALAPGDPPVTMALPIFAQGAAVLTSDGGGINPANGVPIRAAIRNDKGGWAPLLPHNDARLGPDPFVAWFPGGDFWIKLDGTGGLLVVENLSDARKAALGVDPTSFPSGNELGLCVTWT